VYALVTVALPPVVVTTTFTVPAEPAGVVAVSEPLLLTETPVATVLPKVTLVAPVTKFVPVIVIVCPPANGPDAGEMPVTVGAGVAVVVVAVVVVTVGVGVVVVVAVPVDVGPAVGNAVPKYADVKTTPEEPDPVYTIATLDGMVVPLFAALLSVTPIDHVEGGLKLDVAS
jgi:hypothetical protein